MIRNVLCVAVLLISSDAFQLGQQRVIRRSLPSWRVVGIVRPHSMTRNADEDELESSDDTVKREVTSISESFIEYPPTPTLRECFAFALPALGIYACPPLMSLIDASFIGRTSSIELAALGPAGSISDCSPLPLLFLSIAATNLVAKAYANGDDASCARISRASLTLGTVSGIILAIGFYRLAAPLSMLYCGGSSLATRASAETLAPLCASYVAIRAIALPAVVVASIAQAVCIGSKDTKTPMVAVGLAGALNFMGDLLLVSGMGMGIAGAAWATTFSQYAAAALLLRVLQKRGFLRNGGPVAVNGLSKKGSAQFLDTATVESDVSTKATVMSLLNFIPFLFVMGVKIGMHNSCAAAAASLGGAPAAAHTALFAVAMLCFTFGDVGSSLSQAFLPAFATSKSFNIAAATPTLKQLLKCTFTISTTVVCLASTIITLFSGQLTSDPAVLLQMRRVLPLLIVTLSLHVTAVTLEGLLLARKNFSGLTLTYAGVAASIAVWRIALAGTGLMGIWGCYIWFQASRIVAFAIVGGLLRRPLQWWRRRLLYEFLGKAKVVSTEA